MINFIGNGKAEGGYYSYAEIVEWCLNNPGHKVELNYLENKYIIQGYEKKRFSPVIHLYKFALKESIANNSDVIVIINKVNNFNGQWESAKDNIPLDFINNPQHVILSL